MKKSALDREVARYLADCEHNNVEHAAVHGIGIHEKMRLGRKHGMAGAREIERAIREECRRRLNG